MQTIAYTYTNMAELKLARNIDGVKRVVMTAIGPIEGHQLRMLFAVVYACTEMPSPPINCTDVRHLYNFSDRKELI